MSIRILIVDDHELVRVGLRLRLQRETSFKIVAEAADAASAYSLVAAKAPDLVVMDLDLPGENGLQAIMKIKAQWPKTRVLALTGNDPDSAARQAVLAGADGMIFKNEAVEDLSRGVRTIIAGKAFLSADAATALVKSIRGDSITPESELLPATELSERERLVLKGVADGLSYKEIAAEIGVSVKTIDTYRARLVKKLGCTSRAGLVRHAIRLGLA